MHAEEKEQKINSKTGCWEWDGEREGVKVGGGGKTKNTVSQI